MEKKQIDFAGGRYFLRQKKVWGEAYRAGYAVAMFGVVWYGIYGCNEGLPVDAATMMILIWAVSGFVVTAYRIWNDAWFPLNGKNRRIILLAIAAAVPSAVIGVLNIYSGAAFTDGKLNSGCWPLFYGSFMLAELIVALLHRIAVSKEEKQDQGNS